MIISSGSHYWHSTLHGKSLPIHENDPQEGWYRTRPQKGYRSLPVRIWRDGVSGELLALRDGRRVDPYEIWTWVCMNPVSLEAYEAVVEKGVRWPDEIGFGRGRSLGARSGARSVERRKRSSDGARPIKGTAAMTTSALANTATTGFGACGTADADRPASSLAIDHAMTAAALEVEQTSPFATMAVSPRGKAEDGISTATMAVAPLATAANAATLHPSRTMAVSRRLGSTSLRLDQRSGAPTIVAGQTLEAASVAADGVDFHQGHNASHGQMGHNSSRSLVKSDPAIMAVGHARNGGVTRDETAEALADDIAVMWTEVSAWLEKIGVIADQVTADRCANFADAFAGFEKQAEDRRTALKKPVLDEGRKIDRCWKPVVASAEEAKRACKKALEPFLIAETERLERELMDRLVAESGDLSVLASSPLSATAGTFGRTISLRRVRKIVVADPGALVQRYCRDPRFLADEAVQKLLVKLADKDLQAGLTVPGVTMTEEKVAA